jgi:hypothetical protein
VSPPSGELSAELFNDCAKEVPADKLRTAAVTSNNFFIMVLLFGKRHAELAS